MAAGHAVTYVQSKKQLTTSVFHEKARKHNAIDLYTEYISKSGQIEHRLNQDQPSGPHIEPSNRYMQFVRYNAVCLHEKARKHNEMFCIRSISAKVVGSSPDRTRIDPVDPISNPDRPEIDPAANRQYAKWNSSGTTP